MSVVFISGNLEGFTQCGFTGSLWFFSETLVHNSPKGLVAPWNKYVTGALDQITSM